MGCRGPAQGVDRLRRLQALHLRVLITQFNAGLLDAETTLDRAEALAKDILAEDDAHKGSGLSERAYGVSAILENFQLKEVAQPVPPYGDDGSASDGGDASGERELTAIQQAALAIDAVYASDETAPAHWQDKTQLKKGLRGQVRRLVKDLGLEGWARQVPQAVEHYAVIHYSKP